MKTFQRIGYLWWGSSRFSVDYPAPKLATTTTSSPKQQQQQQQQQLLIKVHAAAINPVDYKLVRPMAGPIHGIDVCGEVVEIGSNEKSSSYVKGDMVFGEALSGSLAEYALVDPTKVAKIKPDFLSPTEAAALPVAYLTAITAWNRVTMNEPPDCMVVIGASGGCGLAACQLAKGWGVPRIVAICSGKNADYVKEYGGATEVVDYTDELAMATFLKDNAGKIDHVYDTASYSGGAEDYVETSLKLLKDKTGSYVALNGSATTWIRYLLFGGTGFSDPRQTLHLTVFQTEDLERIQDYLAKAKLKPQVQVFDFTEENCKEGFNLLKSRRTKGKIVFSMT